jgi:cell division protein FtsX
MRLRWYLRRARGEARRRKLALGALAGTMAMAVALGGASLLGARLASALVPRLQQQVHVIAYLDDDLGPPERDRLVEALRRLPGVEQARLVDPAEALARLRAAASSLGGPGAVGSLEPGFLPRSLEIAVRPAPDLAARTAELATRLRKIRGLAEVDDMSEGLGRLESWLALAGRLAKLALALALIAAAAGLAIALVGGRSRRREAEVLALLGETSLGISLPAMLAGAAAALVGAAAGLAVTRALFPRLLATVEATLRLGPLGTFPALGPREVALALVVAITIGGLAGHLAARAPRHRRDA